VRHRLRALALSHAGVLVLTDPHREAELAAGVGLGHVPLSRALRRELTLLGIRTLGELERLPLSEMRLRYGEEAARLHAALGPHTSLPLQPLWPAAPLRATTSFEPPEQDRERLLFAVKRLLHPLLRVLEDKSEAATALVLTLRREKVGATELRVESAAPSRDALRLLELVRLRLERLPLDAAVTDLELRLDGALLTPEQLELLELPARRDLAAGARALARLQAAFGAESVTRARLTSAHLPEARFRWEATRTLSLPTSVGAPLLPPLVRRISARPHRLAAPPLGRVLADEPGRVTRLFGPERLSGGWWQRRVSRDYYIAETDQGALLWIYYDRERRRWMQHGRLE